MNLQKKNRRQEMEVFAGLKLFFNDLKINLRLKFVIWLLALLKDVRTPFYSAIREKFLIEKSRSNYFHVLTRRYQEGKMQGEELLLFENELREQVSYFKQKLQGYLEGKVHGEDLAYNASDMMRNGSLLYVYLQSFEGLKGLFFRFACCAAHYEQDPIERKKHNYYEDEEFTKIVKEVLASLEPINLPTVKEP